MTEINKQPFRDTIKRNKSHLSMNLGADGRSFYITFHRTSGSIYTETCKELFLYDVWIKSANRNRDVFAIGAMPDTIQRTLAFWKRKNLPEFNYEIVELTDDVHILLMFNENKVFKINLVYLDVLCVISRTLSTERELVKSIVDLIPNYDSYDCLQDAVKLILNTPQNVIMNLKIDFIEADDGAINGIADAYCEEVLQQAILDYK
jgi:hypothetical protein